MAKKHLLIYACCMIMIAGMTAPKIQAQENDLLDINSFAVGTEMYIWNRVSDIFDILRGGIAGGPGIGAEVAITQYVQLGAYANNERGVTFPHFFIPFWLVDYYEHNYPIFISHDAEYATASFGPLRAEKKIQQNGNNLNYYFPRDRWDIRAQLDAFFIHGYLNIRTLEVWDFLAGFTGWDPSKDDMKINPNEKRLPADQFGRSVCNILFGIIEIPANMIRVNEDEGDFAGVSKGLGLGVWRFFCREVIGVTELVTFPFGWSPIIEPEYVLFQKAKNSVWSVKKPTFKRDF
ncbi:MAG: exosortase system-associated protein, TIGR04073 family [Lentisphaeria bacterium]